ncbi:MAG: polyprenyl synthetase family protein [Sedimentisphaerales bacterium]|nr:polyprenyl synthetase family protein [Sedimentisphaerales bacterium]MBN2843145.1 polyprenyl synthetase family protein [Sedimentisphaerales bacterium]
MKVDIKYQVPQDRSAREAIREQVEQWFAINKPLAPVEFGTLGELAYQFCQVTKTDAVWLAYVMILMNNSIWQDHLSGVPVAKRLLLLPKCLASSQQCHGQFDQIGLLCAKCGACKIPQIEELAGKLGYVSMIAEGSPIVAELVRSGQIAGIVGVSCLESLEKAFGHINNAAIPAIAVPLLTDGCKDTQIDLEELKQALELPFNPLYSQPDYKQLADNVRDWFNIERLARITNTDLNNAGQTEIKSLEYIAGEGKRYRPFITAAIFSALSPGDHWEVLPEYVQNTAIAVECFHKASLVHDDIEDNDTHRYDKPTLNAIHGNAFAINAGDFIIGCGYSILGQLTVEPEIKLAIINEIACAHQKLTIGQGMEFELKEQRQTVEKVINIFRAKTSPAFRAALKCGAYLAKADLETLKVLDELSDLLGVVYQIKDDTDDIEQDKNSISILKCYENISNTEKIEKAQALQRQYTELCRNKLAEISHSRLKILLARIIDKITG